MFMRILVGSTNPVKVNAVKTVMSKIYTDFEIIPIEVDTSVENTPLDEETIIKGALTRANNAFLSIQGDLSIGMEGGIVSKFQRYFVTGWCAIVDPDGNFQLGCGVYMPIPSTIVELVRSGEELGTVIDNLTGIKDTKWKMGSIGILTNNLMTRQKAWEAALIYAMVNKLSPQGLFPSS